MNEFLADIYNTRESIGAPKDNSDVEKLAEAQLLDEALRAEGVDIDKLPGETILKLAHQLLGDDSALVKAAEEGAAHEEAETPAEEKKEHEEGGEEAGEKEVKAAAIAELKAKEASGQGEETFEEKVAQADFLGRVMAHSYWNEKTDIEKNAAMPAFLEKGLAAARNVGTKAGAKAHELGAKARAFGAKAHEAGKKGVEFAKAHKAHAAVGAGGLAVGGGAGYAAGRHKSKKASAIDMLAEKRAMEWADSHGLLEQSDEEKLAAAVDQRAAEMLAEAGIDVAAVEAAAQK